MFQKFTFEKYGDQVRLVAVEASEGLADRPRRTTSTRCSRRPTSVSSTPVDRCQEAGATGYQFVPEDAEPQVVARFAAMPTTRALLQTLSARVLRRRMRQQPAAQPVIPLVGKGRARF